MFENIPPWAMQQQAQQQQGGFNPAPMIMSPFMRGQGGMPMPPPPPTPMPDQSGATTATPQGLGGISQLLGSPNGPQGTGGMLGLIQAMQSAQDAKAPIIDPAHGDYVGAPASVNVTPRVGGGGMLDFLTGGFGGHKGASAGANLMGGNLPGLGWNGLGISGVGGGGLQALLKLLGMGGQ